MSRHAPFYFIIEAGPEEREVLLWDKQFIRDALIYAFSRLMNVKPRHVNVYIREGSMTRMVSLKQEGKLKGDHIDVLVLGIFYTAQSRMITYKSRQK